MTFSDDMDAMELFYFFFILIFLIAGVVKGITGMGLPTVAMGLLGILISVPEAAAMLLLPALVTNLWQLYTGTVLKKILTRLWCMMLCIAVGTITASFFLMTLDPTWAKFGLGLILVSYAIYALIAPQLQIPRSAETYLAPWIGLLTGIMTGMTGVFVVPAVPYLQALGLNKDELIQALGLSFSVSTLALALGLYIHDALKPMQLSLSMLAIIPALIGMWYGGKIRSKISPQRFKQCFFVFLLLLGLQFSLSGLV